MVFKLDADNIYIYIYIYTILGTVIAVYGGLSRSSSPSVLAMFTALFNDHQVFSRRSIQCVFFFFIFRQAFATL